MDSGDRPDRGARLRWRRVRVGAAVKRENAPLDDALESGGGAMSKFTPCLWFDTAGEEAAKFYTSVFPNSRIVDVVRFGAAGPRPEGTVMTVSFELDGQWFLALNGGPEFTFSEAISFQVSCATQDEVDAYWNTLSAGGEEGQCGWLKDR